MPIAPVFDHLRVGHRLSAKGSSGARPVTIVTMQPARRSTVIGWAAVAAQGVALVGIALSPGQVLVGPTWLTVVGVALFVVGGMIGAVAGLNLGRALTPTPVPVSGAGLRRDGLYGVVRHPIYSGLLMLTLGFVLCAPSPWRFLWWVALLAVLSAKSVWEERMLTRLYPEYVRYRREVGRFAPRLFHR